MIRTNKAWLALWAALALVAPVQAQIYKWTDAQGRVHFGDQAPQNQQSTQVTVKEAPADPAVPDLSEQERLERQQRLVRALEEERLEKEQAKAALKAEQDKKAAYCERFHNRLERMDQASRVYSEKKDGTVRYLDDAEADQYKRDQHARFTRDCG